MSDTKAARLYFHIGNSGFSVSIEDNGNGPEFIFEGGAFGHQMVRSQMLTTREGLRALGTFLVEQSAREFSAPYCHATEMPEPRTVETIQRLLPALTEAERGLKDGDRITFGLPGGASTTFVADSSVRPGEMRVLDPTRSDDPFVGLEMTRRAKEAQLRSGSAIQLKNEQHAGGDYLREQIQQYGSAQSMADRARAADQLNTGAPNDCAGSTACDHAAGLCGAMGSGGEG